MELCTLPHHNRVLFFEEWDSVEAYEAYLTWRGETGVMDRLGSVFEFAPMILYFDKQRLSDFPSQLV